MGRLVVLALMLLALTSGQAWAEPAWIKTQPDDCSVLQSFNIWRGKIIESAWNGACLDGKAEGEGVLTLKLEYRMEDDYFHFLPPDRHFMLIQHGRFAKGMAEGMVLGEYSTGKSVVAEFHEGIPGSKVLSGVLYEGQGSWHDTTMDRLPEDTLGDRGALDGGAAQQVFQRGFAGYPPENAKRLMLPDLTAFDDASEAQAKVLELFPLGQNAMGLMAQIYRFWSYDLILTYRGEPVRNFCRHGVGILTAPEMAWTCLYSVTKTTGTYQNDQWLLMAVLSNDFSLRHLEVHHFFHDQDFVARQRPLKVENFASNKEFMAAAGQVLGPSPTRVQVSDVMQAAGLTQLSADELKARGNDPSDLNFSKPGNPYYLMMTGCPDVDFGGTWRFDPDSGKVRDVLASSWGGCP